MKRFFVYIIYSPVKMIYYIGHTSDLDDRTRKQLIFRNAI
ncbi:MAG: GIY-YIG nuclease family protein [Melioribacteraceae bacterium]|nr:GIY-YIG nuclease family protein [Melioribacteraceae bacterium]MCF8356800.1 GIY-YIG nuclease family protein [Melioribacteraceae bacterium]MCF8394979.1 GIY-YIG nuclease family protein [Melioribacteraceae bacterium]MCF8419699.1 GIY-YIG nuclease family protein [Melioribacteraceae bacterium]